MNDKLILGIYNDEVDMINSAQELKLKGVKIFDFYTPFPIHGLDEILEISRSRLPNITFIAGAIGLILAISFQVWTSAFDWPIDVGGKPMLSIPAFVPVTFELMVLCGALTTVAAFFYVANLFPTKEAKIFVSRQTDDQFVIAIKKIENSLDVDQMKIILEKHGAFEVKVIN